MPKKRGRKRKTEVDVEAVDAPQVTVGVADIKGASRFYLKGFSFDLLQAKGKCPVQVKGRRMCRPLRR